jgi:GDP-4-dehydro-6-deoxy-D-mannose reductase
VRALVTGAAGFVGQWTVRAMLERGWEVTGFTNAELGSRTTLNAAERDAVRWVMGDLRDQHAVAQVIDRARPDVVVHLAAIAFLLQAAGDPAVAADVNVGGTARLLGELDRRRRNGSLDPVVLVIGSAEQYGRHEPDDMPLRESAGQRPLTFYGATKAAQEVIALQVARNDGLRVIATRSFHHSGPGQDGRSVLPALVGRALALRDAGGGTLRIGNTSPVRDYLHVRDVVRAYLALLEHGVPGEAYNVASGVGATVGELAALVVRRVGVDATLAIDPELVRPVDVPILVGDAAKLRLATGWTPSLSCDDVIDDLIHAATH